MKLYIQVVFILSLMFFSLSVNHVSGQLSEQKYTIIDSVEQMVYHVGADERTVNRISNYMEKSKTLYKITAGRAIPSGFKPLVRVIPAFPEKTVYNAFSIQYHTKTSGQYDMPEYSEASSSKSRWSPHPIYRMTYLIGVRTNLLFDLAGAPNIGIEFPIGWNFSVATDFAYAYWRINDLYALQVIQGSIEGRYWFSRQHKHLLTGWNVGVYGTYCSRYDVQWQDGYQGDGYRSAGITGGYSLPVSYNFLLDFSLGAGYFYTPEVRHYHQPENGHLIWEETRYNVGRFSLTKLRINLVWIWDTKKRLER